MNFDRYADEYEALLDDALRVSGENRDYFARARIAWLAACLRKRGIANIDAVLDFGCGDGSSAPHLFDLLGAKNVRGVDASEKAIGDAVRVYGSDHAQFLPLAAFKPNGDRDLVYCNGVFHHIPPNERSTELQTIHRALRPEGLFALWENNPWNPGTRLIMQRCAFDRDAIMVASSEARRMLRQNGFEILAVDYLFIFPKALRAFRFLEPLLAALPLGAQYQILARKIS